MTGSSEEDDMPPTVSSTKRRSNKRPHKLISSESDEDEGKARTSRKVAHSLDNQETNEDSDGGSEKCKSTLNSQTPRSSERLRRKASRSFSMPSREKVLDSVSSGKKQNSQQKVKALKPRKLVNNFLRERTSYVSREERYDSDDSGLSDFINDDDDDDDDAESSESTVESDVSVESNKKDSGICSARKAKKGQRQKSALDSSEKESSLSEEDDVPLSVFKNKRTCSQQLTAKTSSRISSDSDESFAPRNKTNIKPKVLNCSDSSEDDHQTTGQHNLDLNDVKKDNNGERSDSDDLLSAKDSKPRKQCVPLRPRSKRVQNLTQQHEAKNRKILGSLLKKRQTAKLDAKDRLALKQMSSNSNDSSLSSSEDDHDPCKEATEIFLQHSSELEEDDDDRDFIVDVRQSSDEGMNSDGVSQFLQLLDTFTSIGKAVDPEDNKMSMSTDDASLKSRQKRRKKRKERKASKWRRIKMADESEDSDENGNDVCHRHPFLHVAVLENDIPLVKKLIKEDPDCVYELGYRKRTALHLAALEDKVEIVKLLLDHGSDRTALDCYHLPSIAYAMDGHPDCLRLLLDHTNVKSVSKAMRNNLQGMNLLHFAAGEKRDGLECVDRAKCMELLFSKDKNFCLKLLEERDVRTFTPLAAAVYAGQHKCIQVLLRMGANAFAYKTDDGGNILHFAVECASHFKGTWDAEKDTSQCLIELLETTKFLVNDADDHGFTPLMYACESGNSDCVKVLLENGASLNCSDSHGTSSLHLAAMSGDTQCVTLLLNSGHKVDCVDHYGWPPLLYANFKAHESCVLALMKPKPEQVFVLGELLRRARSELEKKRTVKVVKNVLVSLANHDAYYTVFNDFIRQNPEMLEENNYGLLQHTWRAILDFDNKRRWFLTKLSQVRGSLYSWSCESLSLEIDRDNVLASAMNQMGRILGHALRRRSLHVTFKNEPGICTGPKREFFASFCKDVVDPKRGLFIATDDAQFSPVPNAYFAKHVDDTMPQDSTQSTGHTSGSVVKQELPSNESTNEPVMSSLGGEYQHPSTEDESMCVATHDENTAVNSQTQDYLANGLLDEEIISSLSQTESLSSVTANGYQTTTSEHVDIDSVNGNIRDSQHTLGNVSQTMLEEANIPGEEEIVPNDAVDDSAVTHSTDDENMAHNSQQPTWISCVENSGDQSIINLSLRSKLKQLRFIGRMVGFAVCQDLLVNLQLSKPFVKQVLGIPLSHPDDLSSFDYELHRNAVVWLRENSVTDLDLPFSVDVMNPWNSKPVTIELSDDPEKKLLDDNKEQYSKLVSQLKLETLIKDEVAEFSGGLNEVIPRQFLSLFTADEFSLLIGGVTKIDVEDWKKNTKYTGCTQEDNEIVWFWKVVSQLKEEEKALLMKFSTGTPCVPIGGFAALTGLGGATKFTIMKIGGELNKIPMASTCFNMLKLTSYSSEKHLKDKLLIAIRHGAEGFSFS